MYTHLLVVATVMAQAGNDAKKPETSKPGLSIRVGGLAAARRDALVLSFDADRTFRSISGEAVKDKDLKEILRGLHDSNPKQPMHIILHVLNEKAITFDDLGRALKKIESARSKDHDVIVFVHSSQLTK